MASRVVRTTKQAVTKQYSIWHDIPSGTISYGSRQVDGHWRKIYCIFQANTQCFFQANTKFYIVCSLLPQ